MIKQPATKFRDTLWRFRTKSMFVETITAEAKATGLQPSYTLGPYIKGGLPSVKDHFMRSCDPTGYTTAVELFDGWKHWKKVFASKEFSVYLVAWQEELAAAMQSAVIQALFICATTEGSKGIGAAKYVAERGWESKPTKSSMTEKQRARALSKKKENDEADKIMANDAERVRLMQLNKKTFNGTN